MLHHLYSQCRASFVVTCISEVYVWVQKYYLDQDSNYFFLLIIFTNFLFSRTFIDIVSYLLH